MPTDEPLLIADPPPEVAHTSQELQLTYAQYGVQLVANELAQTKASLSSAAIRVRNAKPTVPFATCGMTWVSKHYGVTAAHCVDSVPIRTGRLTVEEEISIDVAREPEIWNYLTVLGTSIADFRPAGTLGAGYGLIRYNDCSVTRRCDTRFGGKQGCPSTMPAENVDIALIKCPNRFNTDYAKTASALTELGWPRDLDDLTTLALDVWWFHELYNLPIEPDGTNRWAQYGAYGGTSTANQNWHYLREHQLLPLLSRSWADGTLYRSIMSNALETNATDVPVCHGTSGSGVFISGTDILLGPLVTAGGNSQSGGRLCERFDRVLPGQWLSNYIRGVHTDAFVRGSLELSTDR